MDLTQATNFLSFNSDFQLIEYTSLRSLLRDGVVS